MSIADLFNCKIQEKKKRKKNWKKIDDNSIELFVEIVFKKKWSHKKIANKREACSFFQYILVLFIHSLVIIL